MEIEIKTSSGVSRLCQCAKELLHVALQAAMLPTELAQGPSSAGRPVLAKNNCSSAEGRGRGTVKTPSQRLRAESEPRKFRRLSGGEVRPASAALLELVWHWVRHLRAS